MTPERWQKVDEVLQATLDLPAAERAALLAEACTGDVELHNEALSLIRAHDAAGDFLEAPALETDAQILLDADEPVREIGPYKIVNRLGRGGMGEVFLAQDRRLGRMVALKTLPAYFVSDDERSRRFQNEARAASALNHPNILTIYEVGESDGTHFIAAEYIEGQTLRELITAGNLTLGEVLDIAAELLSGLSAAHAAGIIHRDIKPENIMRRADGSIRILDFGIAKLMQPWEETTASFAHNQTQTGALMGTIGYVSPEQLRGLLVDERTDIWSCGIVLHEMLTGRRPFAGVTNADTIVAILERPPESLFIGDQKFSALSQLQRIVSKALSKQAEERYRSAADMLEDVRRIKRSLDDVSRKRPAISGETTIDELRTLTAVRNSDRGLDRFLVPGLLAVTLLLIVAALLYRQSRPKTPSPPTPPKIYAQMNEAEKLAFVSEQEQRISAMMGERPMKLNDEAVRVIKSHVDYYVAPQPPTNVESLSVRYQRARPYIPVIARAFEARRIPVVVGIYIAMFESAYKPCAENNWGAKGLFQFLPQTAEHYGVPRADMCDANKMAPAAAHYIADRMAELGDDSQSMTLVLLSFNRGAEAVRDALRQLRESDRNYERNFWTLFANRDKLDKTFRNESANYVPGFFAVAIIGENPEIFGLGTPPLSSLAK